MTSVIGNENSYLGYAIEIAKVNTDSDIFVLFMDGHNVSNPVWVLFLSNEATFDEFLDSL